MVEMPESEIQKLLGLLDEDDKRAINEDKRQEFVSGFVPGAVFWVPDSKSDIECDCGGAHPFVVKEIQGDQVIAYLRTSKDKANDDGCIYTPADLGIGLSRPGYIVISRGISRFGLEDLMSIGCKVTGSLAPELLEEIRVVEKKLAVKRLHRGRGR
jgi:hypothetical protein